jgi:predicted glutamine amidotransferase
MCRVLAYLGSPVLVDDLLYRPDSSLIKQSLQPRMLRMLNLAGFGMAAWDSSSHLPEIPFEYGTTQVPVFDANLKALARKTRAHCLLAHVRGVAYSHTVQVSRQNLHPFRFPEARIALAHNGDLASFAEMKHDLLEFVKPAIAREVKGTTDSEWIYALLLSQFDDPAAPVTSSSQMLTAIERTLRILRRVRERVGIHQSSSVNLFVTDGHHLVATRFTFDFGCWGETIHEANLDYLSQWYTTGRDYGFHDGEWKMIGGARAPTSVIVASEPLTADRSTWIEVPEYAALYVQSNADGSRQTYTSELDA